MNRCIRKAAAAVAFFPLLAAAQTPQSRVVIQLGSFEQTGTAPSDVNIVTTSRDLLRLALSRVAEIRPATATAQPCGEDRPPQRSIQVQQAVKAATDAGQHLVITARFDADPDHFVGAIRIVRCMNGVGTALPVISMESDWDGAFDELTEAISLVVERVREQVPRTLIAVTFDAGKEDGRREAARLAQTSVGLELLRLGDVRIAEPSRGDTPEYDVRGTFRYQKLRSGIQAVVEIRAGQVPVGTVTVEGSDEQLAEFVNEIARRVRARIEELRFMAAHGFRPGTRIASTDAERVARLALCIDATGACVQAPGAAVAALSAIPSSQRTARHWLMLGNALRQAGSPREAQQAFVRASELSRDSLALRIEALQNAIAVMRETKNYRDAAEGYAELMRLQPQDSALIRERVNLLRLARMPVSALMVLGDAIRTMPGSSAFDTEFRAGFTALTNQQVASNPNDLPRSCRATEALRDFCTTNLIDRAEQVARVGGDTLLRSLGRMIAGIAPDPERLARGHLFTAQGYLGGFDFVPGQGARLALQSVPPASVEQASVPLSRATAMADSLSGDFREWLAQLRTLYHLQRNELEAARNIARANFQQNPDDESRLIVVQTLLLTGYAMQDRRNPAEARAAFEEAATLIQPLVEGGRRYSYAYFREIMHGLGRDADARTTLVAATNSAPPGDPETFVQLSFICSEYLKDYSCAYDVQRRMLQQGLAVGYSDTLNVVEAALLVGRTAEARALLTPLLDRPGAACFQAVAHFYHLWLAVSEGAPVTPDRWRRAHSAAVASRGNNCWVFEGARAYLDSPAAPPALQRARGTLLEMIDAMERGVMPAMRAAQAS